MAIKDADETEDDDWEDGIDSDSNEDKEGQEAIEKGDGEDGDLSVAADVTDCQKFPLRSAYLDLT